MCRELRLPLNNPYVQEWDPYDLEFYEYSIICDDPELLKQLENRYVDPDFDAWMEEFDKEQEELQKQQKFNNPELPDQETISWSNTPKPQKQIPPVLGMEEYEMNPNVGNIDDWVKEE